MPAKSDFRDAAVAASQAHIQQADAGEVSFCLRAPGDGAEILRRAKRLLLCLAGVGLACIGAGGIIAIVLKFREVKSEAEEWRNLIVAACFTTGGFILTFSALWLVRRRVHRHVRQRLQSLPEPIDPADPHPIPVTIGRHSVEVTFSLMPSDTGLLFLQPQQRCVRIEGLTHRYLIRAADCLSVTLSEPVQYSESRVVVAYRIGEKTLSLEVGPDSTMKQVGYQLSGKVPALFDEMRRCLC